MYSHFLVYLSVVASPSVFDIHILILSQLNVHELTRENVACAHKQKQTGPYGAWYHLKGVCMFVVFIQYHLSDCLQSVCVCVCQRQSWGWHPYLSSLGGRLSLLSARHVSRANALIHSAYLSSICLHYNHTGIIGFPLCSQIGTFISESYTSQGSALSYSLHLKRIRRQARRLYTHRPHPCKPQVLLSTLGNKAHYCPPHGEVIKSTEGREGGGG